MNTLHGRRIFLSASFPSGERGERFRPYDVVAIADAVTAISRAVLHAHGQVVFGAHPTISPLILLVAAESGARDSVQIYQSRYYDGLVPRETLDLVERGFGRLHWTDAMAGDRDGSLRLMRTAMFRAETFQAAVFIGGMEGIVDEHEMLVDLQPGTPRLPVAAPGGATRRLAPSNDPLWHRLAERLQSPYFPALAHDLVTALSD